MAENQIEQALYLAPNFQPDIDAIFGGNGLAAFGMPGSGKSNFLALLCEQMTRFQVPLLLLDTEGESEDLLSAFPRGVLAEKDALPDAHTMLHTGQQVILNLKSWGEDYENAALTICDLIEALFHVAGEQAAASRVPCAILMDEAAMWLPRRTKSVSQFSKETRIHLLTTFEKLGVRGRKYGLIPMYFTQYISQIDVDVIRSCALRVLMKQTEPLDLKKYGEFVHMTPALKETVQSFLPGQALIQGLTNGNTLQVRFFEQETDHASHTPKVQAALAKFGAPLPGSPPAQSFEEPASNMIFLTKQGEHRLERAQPDIRAKVLQKIEDFCTQGHMPNLRELGIYLHKTSEQLTPIVQELVSAGLLVAHPTTKTTRYTLAERKEA